MSNEPVIALVLGLVTAGIGLLIAFGVPLTTEQVAAIVAFAGAALTLGVWVRGKVVPVRKLRNPDRKEP